MAEQKHRTGMATKLVRLNAETGTYGGAHTELDQGWELVEVIPAERVVSTVAKEPEYDPQYGRDKGGRTNAAHVISDPIFVFQQPMAAVDLREELRKAQEDARALVKEVSANADARTSLQQQLTAEQARHARTTQELTSVQQAKNKLEADLGKARREIGEQKWRELFGG